MFWSDPGFVADFLRGFLSVLDSIGYFFLGGIFNIFFIIVNADIFQGDVIDTFYSRIQMILGILMIFRISITLLQIIVNPDMFKDKQKGAGSLVMRVVVMLVMLTLIVPIDIQNTNGNPLNEQINSNGILFGFLYQFQNSIIDDNILGKLILGSKTDTTTSNAGGAQLPGMSAVGDVITSEIAKSFITPTLNDGYDDINSGNYENAAACPDVVAPYFNSNLTSGTLLDHINDTCNGSNGETYAFDYTGLGGVIVAIVMTIIIIGFTLDVAVRAIKLALLRLIAPVPIISYISPGQEKDGAFGNWVKTLTSTYLSLFIRLIIIYFGIYLIILLINDELVTWVHTSNALTTGLANIFIIIGILVFMKEAPKFFQDMLGIKGDGKLFSGIGTMLGAAALTGGLAGSVVTGVRAGWQEGQDFRNGASGTAGKIGRGALSVLRATGSGVAGGIGGAFVGGRALATTDKKVPGAVYSAMQKNMTRRAAHSTLFGRGIDKFSSAMTGMSPVDRMDAQIEAYNDFSDLYKQVAAKADVDDVFQYTYTDSSGHTVTSNVKALKENLDRLKVSGASPTELKAAEDTYKAAQENLISSVMNGTYKNHTASGEESSFSNQIRQDYNTAMQTIQSNNLDLREIKNAKDFKIASFDAVDKARNMKHSTGYKARKANQQYSK